MKDENAPSKGGIEPTFFRYDSDNDNDDNTQSKRGTDMTMMMIDDDNDDNCYVDVIYDENAPSKGGIGPTFFR